MFHASMGYYPNIRLCVVTLHDIWRGGGELQASTNFEMTRTKQKDITLYHCQTSICEISGGHSVTVIGFLECFFFLPISSILPVLLSNVTNTEAG